MCLRVHATRRPLERRRAASWSVRRLVHGPPPRPPPRLQAGGSAEALALPIIAKDLIIDPIQIAQAISQGADAVLLVASAVAGGLARANRKPDLTPYPCPQPKPPNP